MTWDVAVVGGGPAGAAAAIVLARAGRRTLLVEAPGSSKRKVGESLPGGARPLLRALGALDRVEAGPHRVSGGVVSAWGTPEPVVSHRPIDSPHGAGWHLDRRRFDDDLLEVAIHAGAALERGRIRAVEPSTATAVPPCWDLTRSADTVVKARWVIDATGRAAAVARTLGAERRRDDDLVAVAAWVRAADDDRRTLVEAVPDGWWYTARLPGDERVVVLHVAAEAAAPLLRDRDSWLRSLASTAWVCRIVGNVLEDPRHSVLEGPRGAEATGARLDRFSGDRWLAVGDAALSFDPLSSQGLLHALHSGVLAGEAVDASLRGDHRLLAGFAEHLERARVAYLRHHRQAYRDEPRWAERSFWRRRRGLGT